MSVDVSIDGALTVRQYAEQTGLCLATAYEHVWCGKVPAKQYLGRWLIFLPKSEPAATQSMGNA